MALVPTHNVPHLPTHIWELYVFKKVANPALKLVLGLVVSAAIGYAMKGEKKLEALIDAKWPTPNPTPPTA